VLSNLAAKPFKHGRASANYWWMSDQRWLTGTLAEIDPEIAEAIENERERQCSTLEMIASENFAPRAVRQAQGSVLTNKYAEGYPGKRYYGGCQWVDIIEQLAIDRACQLFSAEHANVQPHSGSQANAAVYHALLDPGDRILGMSLNNGGHLTHGMRINFSGRLYTASSYGIDPELGRINMEVVAAQARIVQPRAIIAGWSAYPRQLDFAAFRHIADEVGAYLIVDMAHFAGLVAAGLHPSPIPYADVVTTTTHKTLAGPRGGMILCRQQFAKAIDSAVFPGQQGGPLEHVIAAKAVALGLALTEEFRDRQRQTLDSARAVAEELVSAGVKVLSDGTDVHLVLVDLRDRTLTGKQAEDRLQEIGITINRNAVPNDPQPPMITSGLRIGTPALVSRGLNLDAFHEIGRIIAISLGQDFEAEKAQLQQRVQAITARFPFDNLD
jgi:glycine hydroxymethyltransferase